MISFITKKTVVIASLTLVSLFFVYGVVHPNVAQAGGGPLPGNSYADQHETPVGPSAVTASCNANLNASVVWNAPVGMKYPNHYLIRIDDMTANGWKSDSCSDEFAGDICQDNVQGTNYSSSKW